VTNVATIPPQRSFVTELALGLWHQAGEDSFKLSEMQVFLPNRRACRELRTAFLQVTGGKAVLLPRLQPLGDVDETELYFTAEAEALDIAPAITPLRRQMLLIRLIRQKDAALPLEQAAALAEALAQLLDQAQTENIDLADLQNLVPHDYAQHWQETLRFLEIVTQAWPLVLQEEGALLDPAEHRNRVLKARAEAWAKKPPLTPVIAAGSTGSMPAAANLLAVIASLPCGGVILPGLDRTMDETAWQAIDETHPQFGMKKFLEKISIARAEVKVWGEENILSPRLRLLQEAMRPAATTEAWRTLTPVEISQRALEGLARIECQHAQEEAEVIALRLRALLEEPEKTALLVTPDRALASRVAVLLRRWGIEANDSAGASLPTLPVGAFLNAVLEAAAPQAAAIEYLTLLKHPLAACGVATAECRRFARVLEQTLWRGLRRTDGLVGAAALLREKEPVLAAWCEKMAALLAPLITTWEQQVALTTRIGQHIACAENLAATDAESGAARLWSGEAGEAAALWLNDWQQAARDFPPLTGWDYMCLCRALMADVTVRPTYGTHARINILGPLEARLQQADLVILGGLNEGVWPPETAPDPWLSRPMQQKLGLPSPERRIGLAAHDFVQLAAAPVVLLTRAKRCGGTPTVPSRFLSQLEAVLQALGYHDKDKDALTPAEPWASWARQLDAPPLDEIEACAPPAPCPPVVVRPRSLSVTNISTWQRNPYAIYAKYILKLKKLEAIDADVTAADRGEIIHKALELFLSAHPHDTGTLADLLTIGREVFRPYQTQPQVEAFWWPRFERIAAWFIATQRARQRRGIQVAVVEGQGVKECARGFRLTGRADRIDKLPDGTLAIIDYKTALIPKEELIAYSYDPQLALLASIAASGGFKGVAPAPASALSYWHLKGGREVAKEPRL
jgi:ATP-dependent helicase/nuclease subunit B